jgi:ABC-type lipoprotein release transport system permease subunit
MNILLQDIRVGARDPLALAAASFLILATAALSSLVPARRATRIDPVAALRIE